MAYQFVTKCINCAKEFGVLWVMDAAQISPRDCCQNNLSTLQKEILPKCQRPFSNRVSDKELPRWSSRAECGNGLRLPSMWQSGNLGIAFAHRFNVG